MVLTFGGHNIAPVVRSVDTGGSSSVHILVSGKLIRSVSVQVKAFTKLRHEGDILFCGFTLLSDREMIELKSPPQLLGLGGGSVVEE